jgi:thioredoxin-disulfide reductase
MYDLIIIGGAPAGLTAGIFASRRKMKTLILTKDIGGHASLAPKVENYPGHLEVKGYDLMEIFRNQAEKSGAQIVFEEVTGLERKGSTFLVKSADKDYETKSVLLAFGKNPRKLSVPGESKFLGKGVSHCATCDMPLFADKAVAIVGGGNTALETALYGSIIAKKVFLIHRRGEFRGFEYLVDKVKAKGNVELVLDSMVSEIRGENFVKSVVVKNVKSNEEREIGIDGIFIEIGYQTNVSFVKEWVELDSAGQIVVSKNCETYQPGSDKVSPGIFAAGDITDSTFKQIVISAGDGAKAALQAYYYVNGIESKLVVDWSHKEQNK